ncbi:protein anachronism isoform X1 [Anopheles arabiensis]|uniref:TGF-beta propeptide domain-containing protein n=1 Tax=Anopheles arabiensis TaxID=7173 RepID=A0A2C9GQ03_ANOAR|nr:protein anachronism isoform X1 [Anopheles arabiensis]
MKTVVPLGLVVLLGLLQAQPTHSAPFNLRDPVEEGLAMAESKMIDFENLTESERLSFLRENINITALKIQQRVLREKQNLNRTSGPLAITQSTTDRNISDRVKTRKEYAEHIIGNIKHNIETNLMRNDTGHMGAATHEMAFSAVCDMPKNTNASQWNSDNTWNLYFRLPHNKQYNSVSSAVLRLYMHGANSTGSRESDNCKNPSEQMIRITTSVYFRKNRKDNAGQERKKICSCITITRSYRGWITLDTLLAVKAWDKPNRNLLIAIDVEDQDDRPMRAADFFRPADCTEASKQHNAAVLPWTYLRSTYAGSAHEMDNVPHNPRLDLMFQKRMHHNHRPYRNKHHYKGYYLANDSTGSATGNSYEHDGTDSKCPRFVGEDASPPAQQTHHDHQHQATKHNGQRPNPLYYLFKELHGHQHQQQQHVVVQHPVVVSRAQMKRRHLNHRARDAPVAGSDGSDESRSVSSASVLSSEERNL